MGRLHAITGPMFSGKTNRLLDAALASDAAGITMVLVRPAIDDRHRPRFAVSHSGRSRVAETVCDSAELLVRAHAAAAVAVDEGQFFDRGIVDAVEALRARGVDVTVAGLELDFRREPFGSMPELIARADELTRLRATCHRCGAPADFTQRLHDGVPVPDDEPVLVVGGAELYEARCPACFGKPTRSAPAAYVASSDRLGSLPPG